MWSPQLEFRSEGRRGLQYKRQEDGGSDEELVEEKPQCASMAARFRCPSIRRVSEDFLPSIE